MQYLDGGRLDLGVVRDLTLDATNDYETFSRSLRTWHSVDTPTVVYSSSRPYVATVRPLPRRTEERCARDDAGW